MNDISLLIIAGGKSSRLGRDKRFVEVGGVGMLERILQKGSAMHFAETFLCVEDDLPSLKTLAAKYGARILLDKVHDAGAMAGIANGLANLSTEWALAVSADMPFFDFNVLRPLLTRLDGVQAVIPEVDGRRQMLASFYRRELSTIFESELSIGQRKIFAAIKKVPHAIELLSSKEAFFNVNTRADLRLALGRAENVLRSTPVISIAAPCSGTGKTTFIERLTKRFSACGIKIGVIKSDAHGFNLDVEGKDSQRFQRAGARSIAVVSPDGWFMIQRTDVREDFLAVADKMTGVDLILTEGRTRRIFPTISLWRGKGEVITDENVVAIFTSDPAVDHDILNFDLNDLDAAYNLCRFLAAFKSD